MHCLRGKQEYAFPAERACSDLSHARSIYTSLIRALLQGGTTCALYFATIHLPATQVWSSAVFECGDASPTVHHELTNLVVQLLSDLCLQLGQRAFVGKVCMDEPSQCPPSYIETTQQSLVRPSRAVAPP